MKRIFFVFLILGTVVFCANKLSAAESVSVPQPGIQQASTQPPSPGLMTQSPDIVAPQEEPKAKKKDAAEANKKKEKKVKKKKRRKSPLKKKPWRRRRRPKRQWTTP